MRIRQDRDRRLIQIAHLPLRLGVEQADRLDLIAEQFDPNRIGRVRREDIDDAAVNGELARQFDRGDTLEPARGQPAREVIQINLITHLERPRRHGPLGFGRHRLNERRDRRHHDARRSLRLERPHGSQTAPEDRVGDTQFTRQRRPRGQHERLGNSAPFIETNAKRGDVGDDFIQLALARQHDQHTARARLSQRGNHQRRRRTPRPIDRRRATLFDGTNHLTQSRLREQPRGKTRQR